MPDAATCSGGTSATNSVQGDNPSDDSPDSPDSAPLLIGNATARHRVLIVDDEEATRLLLARYLTRDLGVEAQLAGTSQQAMRFADNYAYDTILLDLLMPGIGGYQILTELRNSTPNMSTPVVIVSVIADRAMQERCRNAGANAYLVKPVERSVLSLTVKQVIEGRKRLRA